jgi:hypothetical protein
MLFGGGVAQLVSFAAYQPNSNPPATVLFGFLGATACGVIWLAKSAIVEHASTRG